MTFTSTAPSMDPQAAPHTASPWALLAQRCLSLTLRFDYLSGTRGHQPSRREVHQRLSNARMRLAASRTTFGVMEVRDAASDAAQSDSSERRYLSEIAAKARLTSREEYCLAARMRRGERAACEALIEGNLGLVVMIARRYQRPGVPLLDLIAEGNLGLMRAADRFDPERGFRFSTYAKWWVLQAIQQALPKLASVVRIPLRQTAPAHGTPTSADRRPLPLDLVDDGLMGGATPAEDHPGARFENEPWALLGEADGVSPRDAAPGSTDASRAGQHETNDPEVLDSIAIDPEHEPPGATQALQRLRVLGRALDTLRERERIIVAARFALDDDRVHTLDELATRFKVSIERIRQIESAAVKNLEKALRLAGESADSLL